MEIKELQETDLSHLLHWFNNPVALFLSSPSSVYPYTIEAIRQILMEENQTFVLKNEDGVIGCVSYNVEKKLINHLYIHTTSRGKKNSKLLIDFIQQKFGTAEVHIHQDQREHFRLFERMNFQKSSKVSEFLFEDSIETFICMVYEKK